MRAILLTLPIVLLAACDAGTGGGQAQPSQAPTQQAAAATPDPLAAHDPASGAAMSEDIVDPVARPVMQAQVVLDRLGFTPGVVDGKEGLSTRNAVSGFQEANSLAVTGKLDQPTNDALKAWTNIPATRVVTIPADFAAGPFYAVPKDPQDQAKMSALGYASLDEKLAERFHTTIAVLKELNPEGKPAGMAAAPANAVPTPSASPTATPSASGEAFTPEPGPWSIFQGGQQIRVPNVGGDAIDPASVTDADWRATLAMLGVGSTQPSAARIVVSKAKGTMKVFDTADKLVAVYTATMGSRYDPLPLGDWKILGTAHNPPFHYNPDLFWDAKASAEKAKLPPGPNGPVGVVWIDLSKEHYGIHGTPNPETIGRAESHGCVRLTNWDAARLAQMVSAKTQVRFEA
ncbi:MAG TPA: L,D-transpeptidase family protein [Novosphingobium sp.]|nr:L,D-transpeptidase family protein [Novosphingobium sp.]